MALNLINKIAGHLEQWLIDMLKIYNKNEVFGSKFRISVS